MKIGQVKEILDNNIFNSELFEKTAYGDEKLYITRSLKNTFKSKSLDDLVGALVAFESIVRVNGSRRTTTKGNIVLPIPENSQYKHSDDFKAINKLTEEVAEIIKKRDA